MRCSSAFGGLRLRASSRPNLIAALASIVVDDRWTHLGDGAFVVIDKETSPPPLAHDRGREPGSPRGTAELLDRPALGAPENPTPHAPGP